LQEHSSHVPATSSCGYLIADLEEATSIPLTDQLSSLAPLLSDVFELVKHSCRGSFHCHRYQDLDPGDWSSNPAISVFAYITAMISIVIGR
jgi:hypothetical protein